MHYIFFFSLKLHKLPYLNVFIGFNNIFKKIPFSCYIKCNTSHFNEKGYIFHLEEEFFSVFSLHYHVLIENDGKSKKYINFWLQFTFFFSQNGINYPLFSVFKRINISSKKPYLFLVQKKEVYAITRKKFLFTEKVDFSMIFCLFHCFHKKIKEKQ